MRRAPLHRRAWSPSPALLWRARLRRWWPGIRIMVNWIGGPQSGCRGRSHCGLASNTPDVFFRAPVEVRASVVKEAGASDEVGADLAFMETLRRTKARFPVGGACRLPVRRPERDAEPPQAESFFQLAEFFFALQTYGIDSEEKLDRFADLHNTYLLDIRKDPDRMRRYGLTPDRIDSALFTGRICASCWPISARAARRSISRTWREFLVTVMSTETCRKLVLAAEKAGFLDRARSPFGAVLSIHQGHNREDIRNSVEGGETRCFKVLER